MTSGTPHSGTSDLPPSDTGHSATPKRRPRWVLPVGIVVGLVALVIVGLLAWTLWRPVLGGDYSKVHNRSQELLTKHRDEVMFQVVQVAQSESPDPADNETKVDAMMQVVRDYGTQVEELSQERAFSDSEVAEAYRPVSEAVNSYRTFLTDWGASVPPVKHMQRVCHEFDKANAYMDRGATGESFDAAAAECKAAVEQAGEVKVQDGIVQARATYLQERRAAWQLNGEARSSGRIDREKNRQAIRAEHEATNAWQQADQKAAGEVATEIENGSQRVVTAWEEFGRVVEAKS
ncbi:hypothetical protein [Enemella sp. A6]|uniref:hypothetical protein n=1 Tax=Enemella sp. A6 TaxID=3440152 RepID=UPI003EB8E026